MDKKGWIRIAEAFVSALIVIGVAIFVIKGGIQTEDISEEIYDIERGILREIQLDESLRSEILGTGGIVEWDSFPSSTKNKIIDKTPSGFDCVAKICPAEDTCLLMQQFEEDIYAHSILLFSTLTNYNPRRIKLFCY